MVTVYATLKLQYRRNINKNNRVFYSTRHSIHEAHSCTREEAERAAELTQNISNKRAARERRMLIQPNASFFLSLNNDDTTKYGGCTRQFLTVTNPTGQTIATSVLFTFSGRKENQHAPQQGTARKGGLLTSDLKGLLHNEAKASHSYFVMLAHAIQIALRWLRLRGLWAYDGTPQTGGWLHTGADARWSVVS